MSFNDLPLEIQMSINHLLFEHDDPKRSLSKERNGYIMYDIPTFNKYDNEINSLFDFIDTNKRIDDHKLELGQFFHPSVYPGIIRRGDPENRSYTIFNIYKITPKTIFYDVCCGGENRYEIFITKREKYRTLIKHDVYKGYYFKHCGYPIYRNELYSPFIGPLPK